MYGGDLLNENDNLRETIYFIIWDRRINVIHLHRYEIGTKYDEIGARLQDLQTYNKTHYYMG